MIRPVDGDVPICPGIAANGSPAELQRALVEAHRVLPSIPGTRVVVLHWPPVEGFERLRSIGYGDDAIAHLRALIGEQPVPRDAVVVVCLREHIADPLGTRTPNTRTKETTP